MSKTKGKKECYYVIIQWRIKEILEVLQVTYSRITLDFPIFIINNKNKMRVVKRIWVGGRQVTRLMPRGRIYTNLNK